MVKYKQMEKEKKHIEPLRRRKFFWLLIGVLTSLIIVFMALSFSKKDINQVDSLDTNTTTNSTQNNMDANTNTSTKNNDTSSNSDNSSSSTQTHDNSQANSSDGKSNFNTNADTSTDNSSTYDNITGSNFDEK